MQIRMAILVAILVAGGAVAAETEAPSARVYLPRQKVLEEAPKTLTLADLATVAGADDKLVATLAAIPFGRAPLPGETIQFRRNAVRNRLAALGHASPKVVVIGADSVALRRDTRKLSSEEIVTQADAFLRQHPPAEVADWRQVGTIRPLVLPDRDDVQIVPALDPRPPLGHAGVILTALQGETTIQVRRVLFRLSYRSQRVVATKDIPDGAVVGPHNARIEVEIVEHKPEEWTSPMGRAAIKKIQTGAVVTAAMVAAPKPKVVVRRNQPVRIKVVTSGGFAIMTSGIALSDARIGESIKVRNAQSKRIIAARIDDEGDAIPLLAKGGRE